jgi:hypothetical protein
VDATAIVLSHRLTPLNTPPLDKMSHVHFTLQEIIIVGNTHEQVMYGVFHEVVLIQNLSSVGILLCV